MTDCTTATGLNISWGGLESLTGPTVRHRVPGIEPFAEYGTEVAVGNAETSKVIVSVDTAWRSACMNCMDAEIEDVERRLVAESLPKVLTKDQGQRELFGREFRFTLSASDMIQQYEESKGQIGTFLLSKKS